MKNKSKLVALLGMSMLIVTNQLWSGPYVSLSKRAIALSGVEENFIHYIGEEFGGGVIFHLWRDDQGVEHGLIVDKTDLSAGQFWCNIEKTSTGVAAQSGWDGLSNSLAIVGQAGHSNSAAALCLNSTNGGQSDWYLPSVGELEILWDNYYTITLSLTKIAGATLLQSTYYWSSTEIGDLKAWAFNFGWIDVPRYNKTKGLNLHVRAIRAF